MDDDRIEGKLKQSEGEVQETWGDAKEKVGADGKADQAEGKAKQGEGDLKEAWGEAKERTATSGRRRRTPSTEATSRIARRACDRCRRAARGTGTRHLRALNAALELGQVVDGGGLTRFSSQTKQAPGMRPRSCETSS
jgi:uncharacterized protein YjbJ (UPF0337 family)